MRETASWKELVAVWAVLVTVCAVVWVAFFFMRR
jgi:hypothetical protein